MLGIATTAIATFQPVFDFGGRASEHSYLQKRCFELLAELEGTEDSGGAIVRTLKSKMTNLFADEPPMMMALDAIAYNSQLQ